MKEIGLMEVKKEEECSLMFMVTNSKESLRITLERVLAYLIMEMVAFTVELLRMTLHMDMDSWNMQTKTDILEIFMKDRKKEKESIFFLKELFLTDSGKMMKKSLEK